MSLLSSCFYDTTISHRRRRPKKHTLKYGAFYLMLDLDELDRMHRSLKWFSFNGFNIFSFYNRDHGTGRDESLRPWAEHHLARAGIDLAGGSIKLLCLPRILGYVFNPIGIYYCYHQSGQLAAVLYQVSNTFGQRHTYLFSVDEAGNKTIKHGCDKRLYVSPFIENSGRYDFTIKRPSNELYVHIRQGDENGPILDAWVNGQKQPISDSKLLSCLLRYPLLTIKVIGGIHWEALQLWLKGIGLVNRPPPPEETVTIVNK